MVGTVSASATFRRTSYYAIALALYQGVNTEEVLRVVTEGMSYLGAEVIRRTVGKSAISAARVRLGADVMRSIARETLHPLVTDTLHLRFTVGFTWSVWMAHASKWQTKQATERHSVFPARDRAAQAIRNCALLHWWRTVPTFCLA